MKVDWFVNFLLIWSKSTCEYSYCDLKSGKL